MTSLGSAFCYDVGHHTAVLPPVAGRCHVKITRGRCAINELQCQESGEAVGIGKGSAVAAAGCSVAASGCCSSCISYFGSGRVLSGRTSRDAAPFLASVSTWVMAALIKYRISVLHLGKGIGLIGIAAQTILGYALELEKGTIGNQTMSYASQLPHLC
eukprot:6480581-Amphidinium_carterae.1